MEREQEARDVLWVVLDTNALFVPFELKVDVFGELERLLGRRFELVMLSVVKRELEFLAAEGSPVLRRKVGLALRFAERLRLVEVEATAPVLVDEVIFEFAKRRRVAVFTNDKMLRRRLRDISVPVIYVRQKSRLEIDGLV